MVEAEPIEAFHRDAMDLVVITGDRLVVNHLLEHDVLTAVQLKDPLDDLKRVPVLVKASIFE